jgi:hypothetical protein
MASDLDILETTLASVEAEIGVKPRRRRKGKRLGKSRRQLVRAQYTKDRGFLLTLGYWDVAKETGDHVHTFIGSPQVPFRPRRLVLNEFGESVQATTGNMRIWQVDEIKIGTDSQFVQGNSLGMPGAAFIPGASEILFKFDSCPVGREIAVTISNVDQTYFEEPTSVITAGMIGHAADR